MDFDQLKQILVLVREHGVTELELEDQGWRLKLRTEVPGGSGSSRGAFGPAHPAEASFPPPGLSSFPASAQTQPAAVRGSAVLETDVELAVVKSPIVGTFYRSAEPGGSFFVEVGGRVKKGQVLCIIEAMKLMNEIDSEYDGEVVTVYVENGQPVQYGERLFAIRTK